MTEEFWKPIKGYENIYEISNLGHVRSCDYVYLVGSSTSRSGMAVYTHLGRELKPTLTKSGTYQITLRNGRNKRTYNLAMLVADHFLSKNGSQSILYFKNFDKSDCRAENLGWQNGSQSRRACNSRTDSSN